MREKIQALAKRNREAKNQAEKDEVRKEMENLKAADPKGFIEALESLIHSTAKDYRESTMADRMGEVTKMVSMAYIARTYFGKSRSWLAHKLHGDTVNGKPSAFTDGERLTLKHAFADMSTKLGSLGVSL